MIEVFKTNVQDWGHAERLLDQIHKVHLDYRASFDLEDCDKILRVECATRLIQPAWLIDLLRDFGYQAEVLEDCP